MRPATLARPHSRPGPIRGFPMEASPEAPGRIGDSTCRRQPQEAASPITLLILPNLSTIRHRPPRECKENGLSRHSGRRAERVGATLRADGSPKRQRGIWLLRLRTAPFRLPGVSWSSCGERDLPGPLLTSHAPKSRWHAAHQRVGMAAQFRHPLHPHLLTDVEPVPLEGPQNHLRVAGIQQSCHCLLAYLGGNFGACPPDQQCVHGGVTDAGRRVERRPDEGVQHAADSCCVREKERRPDRDAGFVRRRNGRRIQIVPERFRAIAVL